MVYRYKLLPKNSIKARKIVQGIPLNTETWVYFSKPQVKLKPFLGSVVEEEVTDLLLTFLNRDNEFAITLSKLDNQTKSQLKSIAMELGSTEEEVAFKKKSELLSLIKEHTR